MKTVKEYIDYIDKLISLTTEDKIVWKRANPTTFFSEIRNKGSIPIALFSLQKVVSSNAPTYFVFVVKDTIKDEDVIELNSKSNFDYKNYLENLFNNIESSIEKRNLKYLDDIFKVI